MLILTLAGPAAVAQAKGGKYIVNSTLDASDANTADTVCDDGAGHCTLRAAIEQANAHLGKDTINFKITSSPAPWLLQPNMGALPAITDPVVIDGSAGTGASCKTLNLMVTLDGTSAGGSSGLVLVSGAVGSTIKGLVIDNFSTDGIQLFQVSKVLVQCNIIGLQRDGVTTAGNGQSAVHIDGGGAAADQNTIGGASATRNILSGNNNYGVLITNIVDPAAKGNKVLANYIGTDITGKLDKGNNSSGIYIGGAPKTIIGGKTALGNLISGNFYGIYLATGSDSTVIQGNKIGVDQTGLAALGNSSYGIIANDSQNIVIGGAAASYANQISGNGGDGIWLGGGTGSNNATIQGNLIGIGSSGSLTLTNTGYGINLQASSNSIIGGTSATFRNVISGNNSGGINLEGASTTGNKVQGNFIGTDKTGYISVPNIGSGVVISNASGNLVGGNVAGARNLISGNTSDGVTVQTSSAGNSIQGNYIGVNLAASAALPNNGSGVSLSNCTGCLVGGSGSAAERNLLSGNGYSGVSINNGSGNQVFGNFIGTNAAGTAALPNNYGLNLNGSSGNQIGSSSSLLARNVISGQVYDGISMYNETGDSIQGNYIGLTAAGTASLGNNGYGVTITGTSTGNLVGGAAPAARNVISNNYYYGVYLSGAASNSNVVQGNYIGLDATGSVAMGNGQGGNSTYAGIYVSQTGADTIGGSGPGEGNVISANTGGGISLYNTTGTVIKGNTIGLDAAGVKAVGNGSYGLYAYNAPSTVIGGPGANEGNVISANVWEGIYIATSNDAVIKGNRVGTDRAGTAAVPNLGDGIAAYSLNNLTIGGPGATDGNLVSGNTGSGISYGSVTGTVTIRGNAIGTDITHTMALGNAFSGINGGSSAVVAGNIIAFNGQIGIYQSGSTFTAGSTGNCLFYNLIPTGLNYYNTVGMTFTNNWWGDSAGPLVGTSYDYTNPARQHVVNSNVAGITTFSPFLTSAPSGCPVGTQMLAINRGMETDTTPADGIPDGWTATGVSVTAGEGLRYDTTHSGGYAMKMLGGGATSISQTTAISGNLNDPILLTFHTRGVGVSGTGSYLASVKIGTKVFTANIPVDINGSTGGWVVKTLNFRAPANFTSITVTLSYSKPYGSVWFDDVNLMDIALAP